MGDGCCEIGTGLSALCTQCLQQQGSRMEAASTLAAAGCPPAQMSWGQPHFALGSSFLLCWGGSMGRSGLRSLWSTASAWNGDENFRPQPSRASGPPQGLAQSHFTILRNPSLRKHTFTLGEPMAALGYTSLIHASAQDSIWKL